MDIAKYIDHPELLDRETLYGLRSLIALYPYYQSARLLLLKNLYLLHDPTFNEELRSAALYITDRRVIFDMVEAAHYQLKDAAREDGDAPYTETRQSQDPDQGDRTISLIDNFLETLSEDEREGDGKKPKRKPTPADAAVDYVSYLLETESEEERGKDQHAPQMKGQKLIDNFINKEGGKIKLNDEPEYAPEQGGPMGENDENAPDEGFFTETLAKIYIKQGRYNKALEIIQRLNLNYPKKSSYFVDQMRFLEKLILNDKNNK